MSQVSVRENINKRKIIALVLVAISFITLFFPWITMSIEVMGQKYTVRDLLSMDGSNPVEMEEELREDLWGIAKEAAEDGVTIKVNKLMNVFRMILDGKITPIGCADAATAIGGLIGDIVKTEGPVDDVSERYILSQIQSAQKSITTAAVVMWIAIMLLTGTMIYAICSLLTGKKYGIIAYASVTVVFFAVFAIATSKLNNGGILGILGDLLEEAGASDFKLFHLTAAPFLCVITGISAVVVEKLFVQNKHGYTEVLPTNESVGKWVCGCGATNSNHSRFCYRCGRKQMEGRVCSCGEVLRADAAFCTNCGKRIGGGITGDRPEPAYGPVYKPEPSPKPDPVSVSEKDPWQDLGDLL